MLLLTQIYCATTHAEPLTGPAYTNFGLDLQFPVFPKQQSLEIFSDKSEKKLLKKISDRAAIQLDKSNADACIKKTEIWVRCVIGATVGWVKRDTFFSADEIDPAAPWPFQYWLYVASMSDDSEESNLLWKQVASSPYLIKPKDFDNVFFAVYFDKEGFAISSKTGKKTGDRVFMVDNAVYLGPDDPKKRLRGTFLFLNYYNKDLQALCPGRSADSCYSAVNLSGKWPGIRQLYSSPASRYAYNEARQKREQTSPWFGAEQVAFGRHEDDITPFMYSIPDDVALRADYDNSNLSDEQKQKLRRIPVCLLNCGSRSDKVRLNPKPGMIDLSLSQRNDTLESVTSPQACHR